MQNQICRKCGKAVVHPEREYLICLDCLIKMLADEGVIAVSRFRKTVKGSGGDGEKSG